MLKNKCLTSKIEFYKVDNDVNGNPRYVSHYLSWLTSAELDSNSTGSKYGIALHRAKKLGGRKFHNKQYGGGIVITSYNLCSDEARILELVKSES